MSDEFEAAANQSAQDIDGENIARLERTITCLEDRIEEQRFLWVSVLLIVVDLLTFGDMQTWAGPIGILVIQVVILVVLAKRCGIEEVGQLLDKVLNTKPLRNND